MIGFQAVYILSETLAMPAALAVGGLGRKGSYRLRFARPVSGAAPAPLFLCEIIWVDLIYIFFGAADNVLVYYYLLIISVRRPVF